jgi:hypothetical protein
MFAQQPGSQHSGLRTAFLVRGLLAGTGEPYVVVRLGFSDSDRPLPPAPRRRPEQVIEIEP